MLPLPSRWLDHKHIPLSWSPPECVDVEWGVTLLQGSERRGPRVGAAPLALVHVSRGSCGLHVFLHLELVIAGRDHGKSLITITGKEAYIVLGSVLDALYI